MLSPLISLCRFSTAFVTISSFEPMIATGILLNAASFSSLLAKSTPGILSALLPVNFKAIFTPTPSGITISASFIMLAKFVSVSAH